MLNDFQIHHKPAVLAALLTFMAGLTVYAADTATATDGPVMTKQAGQSGTADLDTPRESGPDYARLRKSVRDYETSIMQLEKTRGANDKRIAEESVGLGLAYRDLGQYQKASEAFDRALRITRVTLGPEDPGQLPILEQIIKTNTAAADWEDLEDNYQLLYWVSRRIYAQDDARLLEVIYRLAHWHLHAYLAAYDPIPYKHLLEAEKLYHDAVDVIEKHSGADDPRLLQALNGIAIADYHIISHIYNSNSSAAIGEIQGSTATMSRVDNVSSMLVWQPVTYGVYERKKVFRQIADIYNKHNELTDADRATALVNIGDWYFIYGWNSTALKNYNKAYQVLTESKPDHTTLNRLFGKPVRIPTLTMNYPPGDAEGEHGHPYVKISFDVTRDGCAKHIKFIAQSNPDKFMYRKRAKDYMHASLFRPKIVRGKTVRARNLVLTLSGDLLKTGTDRRLVNYDRFHALISVNRCGNASR